MKPLGLSIGVSESGGVGFSVNRPSRVEDAIWDAVKMAIEHGMTPEKFRNEAASAWKDALVEEARYAEKVLSAR